MFIRGYKLHLQKPWMDAQKREVRNIDVFKGAHVSRVVKGGFYRSFDLNLLFLREKKLTFFTLVGFLFPVPLVILDSYPTYYQENVGEIFQNGDISSM